MAKQQKNNLEKEVDVLTENWIGITKAENPLEFAAWMHWRRENIGSAAPFEKLTVPSLFPPATINAAKAYIDVVGKIRSSIGWASGKVRFNKDPSAWMGEV